MAETNYGYRDQRGASYMDTYDRKHQKSGSNFDMNVKEEGGWCTNCSKHFLFFVNFFLFLVGIVLIIVGVYILDEDYEVEGFGNIDVVSWFAIISGICVTLVGFCGCASAASEKKLVLTVFIVFLIIILLVEIALVIMALVFESTLKDYLEDQWDDATDTEKASIQDELTCCSFDAPENDSECCDPDEDCNVEGCYQAIRGEIETYIAIILGVAIGVAIYDVVMIVVAVCLCRKRNS